MIGKPPELGTQKPEVWIKKFLAYFQEVRFEFLRVKTIWFAAQSNDQHGTHPGEQITAGNSSYISLIVPREVNQIKEAVVRFIPTTNGTIDWTVTATYGGKNQDESASTASTTADTLSVTDDRIMELDVTSIFDAVQKDDQVGVKVTLDAVAGTANIYVLGLYFKFN